MTAKRQKKEKDVIDLMLDQLDFHGMTKDELTGKDGLLRQLTSRFYERILNAEMDEHLGYKKHDNAGDHCGNSRNGTIVPLRYTFPVTATVRLNRSLFPNMRNEHRFSTIKLYRCTHTG